MLNSFVVAAVTPFHYQWSWPQMRSALTCTMRIRQPAWFIASASVPNVDARECHIAVHSCIAVLAGVAWRESNKNMPMKVLVAVSTAAFVDHRDEFV